eukprot:m.27248 g.27248  ORF g.27248 m.27248 type:complete len:906 (-) comp6403_c0_seq2:2079-4796(-)
MRVLVIVVGTLISAHASIRSSAVPGVPRLTECGAATTWKVETQKNREVQVQTDGAELCLCPVSHVLDARNNQSLAVVGACGASTGHCGWKSVTSSGIVAASSNSGLDGQCLSSISAIWPIPVGRNFVVQMRPCSSADPAQTWSFRENRLVNIATGTCLDAGDTAPHPRASPSCENETVKSMPFCQRTLSPVRRAADLVQRLTVDELAGALTMSMPATETPAGTTKLNQRITAPFPRLNIPSSEFSESCHGILSGCLRGSALSSGCPTSFPMPIGQAASFNESLMSAVANTISIEGRALSNGGVNGVTYFAPNINCIRDPRWGRGYETAGEDALVNGRFAVRYVQGLQGNDPIYLRAAATCKHSLLYDVEHGRSTNSINATRRDLSDYFLVPFEFCIKRANVASIMCQYGAMENVPSCANSKINNGVYRDQYNFSGYLVSDCDAVADFSSFPPYPNASQAAADGIMGGLDVDCGTSYSAIPGAVREGLLAEKAVRTAATRFFSKQIALGLLDHTPFDGLDAATVDTPSSRALAVDAAGQSLVLLRNELIEKTGARALPVDPSSTFCFAGPHTESTVDLLGNYHGVNVQVLNQSCLDEARHRGLSFTATDGVGLSGIAAAVACAKAADVAVLFMGLTVHDEGEGHDRTSLALPQAQVDLITNVSAVQPHTIVVLINGGALAIEPLVSGSAPVAAVVEAFYPGQGGATAIFQALLGERNTWGKLPYTIYPAAFVERSVMNFDLLADGGLTYRHYTGKYGKPLFEFGFGLSYTRFTYEWGELPKQPIFITDLATSSEGCFDCSPIALSVKVSNVGNLGGDIVILGFVTGPDGVRSLFDFNRLTLSVGATGVSSLSMDRACTQAVTVVDQDGARWMTPGTYVVEVGDLDAPLKHTFEVSGRKSRVNPQCP